MVPKRGQDVEHEMLRPGQNGHKANEKPKRPRTWKVMASMISSIVAGLLFALIHHFFYTYWNGKVVASDSQQRWIIRGGTAFAFGLKTALALGTSIAYVQYFWLTVCAKDFQVGKINSLFKVLSNVFEFTDLRLWSKLPMLTLLAVVTWTLPLAAIVSPGTLIVTPSSGNSTQQVGVPQLDYRDYSPFASPLPEDIADFVGASPDLIQLTLGSATTQSILPISPPVPNSTYSIQMYAPALSCQEAFANDSIAIETAYDNYTDNSGGAQTTYLAWTPAGGTSTGDTCFNSSMAAPTDFTGSDLTATIDGCYGYSKKLNIFVPMKHVNHTTGDDLWWEPVLLNCSLRNASYTVDFDFLNRAQNVEVRSRELLNGVAGLDDYDNLLLSKSKENVTMANTLLSYISIMDAFGRLMVGAVTTYHYGTITSHSTLILSTGLAPLLPKDAYGTYGAYNYTNATFSRAVEKLFENVTLSLLSSNQFTVDFSNQTDAAGIPLTPVTVFYPQNIYKYEPKQLWLAYGIALLANLICLLVGLFAIHRNGLSYNNDFMTIMRTTRNHNLDILVPEADSNGAQPVAARTKRGTITYRPSNEDGWAGFSMEGMN